MSKMYIRIADDGFIYEYNEIMAANPKCEVISEEVAFPERFVPPHVAHRVADPKAKRVGRKSASSELDLSTAEVPEPPSAVPAELAEEASKGLV